MWVSFQSAAKEPNIVTKLTSVTIQFSILRIMKTPGDSTRLHSPCPVVYLMWKTQLGVYPEDRTAEPTRWTTCLASAA